MEKVIEILEKIKKSEGAFNRDPLIHAENTIENMKELAQEALELLSPQASSQDLDISKK